MSGICKAIIIGNLGKDPEIRQANGKSVTNFSVAVNQKYGDKESTEWINLVLWDKMADLAGRYLKKGSQCYFEGRIQTREWENKEGVKQKTTEVVVQNMTFLGGGKKAEDKPAATPAPQQAPLIDDSDVPF